MRRAILTIVACGAVAFAGCGDSGGSSPSSTANGGESSTTTAKGAAAEVGKKKPKVEVPSGPPPKKLEKKDIVEGDGAEATSGDEVTVQYRRCRLQEQGTV
jgi:FKBP-type peptidyl-prolyl cis-trans isomerase